MQSFVWSNGNNICCLLSGVMETTYAITCLEYWIQHMQSFAWSNGDNICNHLSGVMETTYAIICLE